MRLKWFDPVFLKKLELLLVASRRAANAAPAGEMFVARRGCSVEFMDFKEYTPDDDYRYIDWNLYGRLDRLYVRVYKGERSLSLHIFLDASRSMGLPKRDKKIEYAAMTALAIAYAGLINGHRVKLLVLSGRSASGKRLPAQTPFYFGIQNIFHLFRFLEDIEPDGESDLLGTVKKATYRNHNSGTAVIISDFWMEPQNYKSAVAYLRYKNFDTNALNILGKSEIVPLKPAGRMKIRDCETGLEKRVFISRDSRQHYIQAVQYHREELRRCCMVNKARFIQADTRTSVEELILKELPHLKLLR